MILGLDSALNLVLSADSLLGIPYDYLEQQLEKMTTRVRSGVSDKYTANLDKLIDEVYNLHFTNGFSSFEEEMAGSKPVIAICRVSMASCDSANVSFWAREIRNRISQSIYLGRC